MNKGKIPWDSLSPEEKAELDELMRLVVYMKADKDMPIEVIKKQPEHVSGFIFVGKN